MMRGRLAGSPLFAGLVGGAVVVAVVGGGAVAWSAVTAPASYTGCLGSASGGVYNVKKGGSPLAACAKGDKKITLSGGDITAVTAGTGLTGGATSGAATLGLASGYQLPQGCADDSSPVAGSGGWACGSGTAKQFSYPAIAEGSYNVATLGSLQLQLLCETGTIQIRAADTAGGGGDFNIFGVQNGSTTAFQHGYALPPDGDLAVATNTGSTASFTWADAAGNVTTGTLNWFYNTPTNTCDFEGDMIHPQS